MVSDVQAKVLRFLFLYLDCLPMLYCAVALTGAL